MSLSFSELKGLIKEIAPYLLHSTLLTFSEVQPRYFLIEFKKSERHFYLLICMQEPFLRIHLTKNFTPSSSLHPFHQLLNNASVQDFGIIHEDRIVKIKFPSYTFLIELFPKSPNFYLLDNNQKIIWSLNPYPHTTYQIPLSSFTHQQEKISVTSEVIEKRYGERELTHIFIQHKQQAIKKIQERIKRANKKLLSWQRQYEQALKWPQVLHQADLLKNHFHLLKKGMSTIHVFDWQQNQEREYALNPQLSPADQLSTLYHQAKKLKENVENIQKQKNKQENEILLLQQTLQDLEQVETEKDLNHFLSFSSLFQKTTSFSKKTTSLPYREFFSAQGFKIWVGKGAKENDLLTFRLANGSDLWFHTADYPGSHVILKSQKAKQPDEETLKDAMQLALSYSQAKDKPEASIVMTMRKYVSKMKKNVAGLVSLSQHKIFDIINDKERLNKIKHRGKSGF